MIDDMKKILQAFVQSIACARSLEPDSYSGRAYAYAWLYATKDYLPLMGQPRVIQPLNKAYQVPVQPLFDEWVDLCLDVQNKDSYRIPDPLEEETLWNYLKRLHTMVSDEKERRKIWLRSLRSFTEFLRVKFKQQIEILGDLESIFPKKMEFVEDVIIRKVPKTLYPIDIWAASQILQNLAFLVMEGRPNAQASAAQALGLAWVCLAAAHARCTTRLDFLHEIAVSSMQKLLPQGQVLLIRARHIKREVPISKTLYDYLDVLSKDDDMYVFGKDLRSYRRSFDHAVSLSNMAHDLGKITFYTLMHRPHEVLGYRHQDVVQN